MNVLTITWMNNKLNQLETQVDVKTRKVANDDGWVSLRLRLVFSFSEFLSPIMGDPMNYQLLYKRTIRKL